LKNPEEIHVREIMSTPLICGNKEMEVEDAVRLMLDKKIKKLPIIEKERLIGIVSLADLLHSQPEIIETIKEITTVRYTPKRILKVIEYYVNLPTKPLITDHAPTRKLKEW